MATSNASMEHGALIRQWTWPLRMIFWWIVIGVLSWSATMAAHWYWAQRASPDDPITHERMVLEREVLALSRMTPGLFDPREVAAAIGNGIRDTALQTAVGFSRALMQWPAAFRQLAEHASPAPASTAPKVTKPVQVDVGQQFVAEQLLAAGPLWQSLLTGTYIFAVRTAMYLAAAPLLALLIAVAAADGFVARAQRKATAGRESASIYHRAKLGASFVSILGYMACMLVPSLERPDLILLPLAALVAVQLRLQAAYYKKYL